MTDQSNPSVFHDDWRACLREQYMTVVREQDHRTLQSLAQLMVHDLGFTEAELAELRVMATMHVDDVADDFVPDLKVLEPEPQPVPMPQVYEDDDDDEEDDDIVQLSLF